MWTRNLRTSWLGGSGLGCPISLHSGCGSFWLWSPVSFFSQCICLSFSLPFFFSPPYPCSLRDSIYSIFTQVWGAPHGFTVSGKLTVYKGAQGPNTRPLLSEMESMSPFQTKPKVSPSVTTFYLSPKLAVFKERGVLFSTPETWQGDKKPWGMGDDIRTIFIQYNMLQAGKARPDSGI